MSARPVAPGFSPLDDELALLPGHLTPRVQEALVRLSTWIPSFAKAADELAWFTQVQVGRETARRLTEAAGATAVAQQNAAAEHILQHHPAPPPGPEQLVFSVDGAMIPLVHGVWTEVRTLAVGEVVVAPGDAGVPASHTTDLSYFSRRSDSVTFTDQAVVELHRRGVERAVRVGAVGDGAEWCQQFIDVHAPHALRMLDFPHAAEYVCAIGAHAADDGPLLTPSERITMLHDLKHQGPEGVLERLRRLIQEQATSEELTTQLNYLQKRTAQMRYPQFQSEGWPIGSGMVESANKLVVEDRLKGAGMHWADGNVNPLLALRNAVCNDRWEEVWAQIEQGQRQHQILQRRARQHRRRLTPTSTQPARASAAAPCTAPPAAPAAAAPRIGDGRPAANHPWRKAWSIRQQCKDAAAR